MFPWMQHEVSGCAAADGTSNNAGQLGAAVLGNDMQLKHPPGNAAMREFMDRLTSSTNVSKWIELPMICVTGDTSSGKSSLLSNLSMVELPSSHKLTTRCPIQLQMMRSETLQARVNVSWRSSNRQLPEFGERILGKDGWDTIPDVILEAQQHILLHTKKEVAPDVVSLTVQGPDCHDLTLIDLPGLVRSKAQDESETLAEDVDRLMDDYLRNNRCVIIACLPANVDFHNSNLADIMKVDPTTSRTIPVITKPDLIDVGAEDNVLELLQGKKVSFSLKFHMVKGRGQAALDRKETIHEGLTEEVKFFEEQEPWKSVEDRSMFGTVNLRQKLGDLQMRMIRQSVPGILEEIRRKQQAAMKLKAELGEPFNSVSERRRFYQDLCQNLVTELKSSLSGKGRGTRKPSAAASLHEACSEFKDRIRDGSLGTIKAVVEGAQVLVTSPRGVARGEIVHLDDDFACVDYIDDEDCQSDALFEFVGRQAQDDLEENVVWSDGTQIFIARKNNIFDSLKKVSIENIRTDPSWLKEKIAENRTDDLPCFLNVEIFKNIIEDFIEEDWKPHCMTLLVRMREILTLTISDSIERTLTSNQYASLRLLVERQCRKAAEDLMAQATKQIVSHLDIEKHPYTQDNELFENISAARHRGLKRELESALRLEQGGVFDTQAIKVIVDGVFGRSRAVEDHMAEEMEIVLESYGQVATRRVIDRSPMICWELFRSLAKSVQESLWDVTDEMLVHCTQKTLDNEEKYRAISEELEEMSKALSIFESIV
jgi:GTP-binding protein EngB required for normal cell division